MTKSEFIRRSDIIHNKSYDYSEVDYVNNHTQVKIKCKKHEYYFNQLPIAHIHREQGCPQCYSTDYNSKAVQWLNFVSYIDNINIQHAENGSKYKIPGTNYIVDGYCSTTNTIYEFYRCLYCTELNEITNKRPCKHLFDEPLHRQYIESMGYTLVTIWQHEWNLLQDSPIIKHYYDQLEILIKQAIYILKLIYEEDPPKIKYKIYTGSAIQIRQIIRFLLKNLLQF